MSSFRLKFCDKYGKILMYVILSKGEKKNDGNSL